MHSTHPHPSAARLGTLIAAGVVGGALAGAAAGLIDGLWSADAVEQFVSGLGGRVRALLFLAAAYGLAGAALGPLVLLVGAFYLRFTRLGDLVRHASAMQRAQRERDPAGALAGLSLALAGVPITALVIGGTYIAAVRELETRNHTGLIVAVALAAGLAALCISVLLAFAFAPAIESTLRQSVRRWPRARALSSPYAPAAALALLGGGAAVVGVIIAQDTLQLLTLRPLWAALVLAVLAWPGLRAGARAIDALRRRARWGAATAVLVPALLLATALGAGAGEGARKAGIAYSGLGGPLTRLLRALGDFDRDGYSRLLGGGDCDDLDAAVNPGALEVPDDGIDQNCVGGDATWARDPDATRYAELPASVPADANIILITIDTLRADHLGAYGYARDTSPVLDQLAREGSVFRNAWAHAPSTRYSMPAILTGRYPLSVVYDFSIWWPALDPRATTVAEALRNAGFYTGAVLNYHYFEPQRRMNQGFDVYDNSNARLHRQAGKEGPAKTQGSSSREQTDKAIQFVADNSHRRFFLWVHYYDPHYDYERHAGVPSFGDDKLALYDHEIRYTDREIGRLFDELRRRELYDRTIVMVTGDHGEGFGERGIDLHGYHLYAAQTKVPLIARVPGLPPREVVTPAGHVDILPTLANLAGAPASPDMQGRSLVGFMTGAEPPQPERWVFQQLSYEGDHELRGAANAQCHVIYNVSPQNSWELYRIATDPAETRDMITEPGACEGARAALERWYDVSELPPQAAEALLDAPPAIDEPLDVDFGDSLRLLEVRLPGATVRPGESFEVSYTWQATGRIPDGWKVFVHFEAPGGGRFLGDHEPARPFSWWRDGQFIRYETTVSVPANVPRGGYVAYLGLFRGKQRLTARAAGPRVRVRDDRAAVGTMRVQ